jgi:hypothetical protein
MLKGNHFRETKQILHIDSAMVQAVSRRLGTAEAGPRSRVSPCGIGGGKSGTGTGFFSKFFSFALVNIITPVLHYTGK